MPILRSGSRAIAKLNAQEKSSFRRGVTLVELLVAISAASLVILGLSRLFVSSVDSHAAQVALTDLTQNTQYAQRYVVDVVMQIGSDLPDSGLGVYRMSPSRKDSIEVLKNDGGGTTYFGRVVPATLAFPVEGAVRFKSRDTTRIPTIVKKPYDRRLAVELYQLDVGFSSGGWSKGIHLAGDSLRVTSSVSFDRGDMLYAYIVERYYLRDNKLYHNNAVVCENIDSVAITFYTVSGALATGWDDAANAEVAVRGRTGGPLKGFNDAAHGDSYKRTLLTMKFRLRNKV